MCGESLLWHELCVFPSLSAARSVAASCGVRPFWTDVAWSGAVLTAPLLQCTSLENSRVAPSHARGHMKRCPIESASLRFHLFLLFPAAVPVCVLRRLRRPPLARLWRSSLARSSTSAWPLLQCTTSTLLIPVLCCYESERCVCGLRFKEGNVCR